MGARSSKPQPSARVSDSNKWFNSLFKGLKRSKSSRKSSKDSRSSRRVSQDPSVFAEEKSLEKNDEMRPEADINANEVDAASPLKRPSNTSEEENVRDAPDDSKLTVADLSASLPLPKEASAIHNEEELNEQDLDDSMSRPLTNDHVPAIDSAKLTPRSYDDIPVGTVFAFQKTSDSANTSPVCVSARRLSRGSAKSQSSEARASNEMIASSANVITDVEQSELEEKDKIHEKADELLQKLNSTISDILAAAVEVEAFLDTHTDIPQDISDEITAVVGGCRLLCQDKLGKQFRNLCLKAKGELPLKKDEVAPPTEEDLVGFWELVNIQVDHMKEKCENIKKLKENQWQVEVKQAAPKKVVKKKAGKLPAKKTAAQIEAQKKRDEERKARFAALRAKKSELARKDEPADGGIL